MITSPRAVNPRLDPPYPRIMGLWGSRGWQLGRLCFGGSLLDPVAAALRAASADHAVLITGESGTGKELVAELIHAHSPRAGRPFVALNCGSIPSELVESELFGHVRGAYTSAQNARLGAFGAAHQGTLFLDELGELPLKTQPALLRTLETRRVRPVGSEQEREVDVRVVAATNRDLYSDVANGQFRADLVYRLDVLRVHLPPLRERLDELELLVPQLLLAHGEPTEVSRRAVERLRRHEWPGNVRELRNVLLRASQHADGRIEAEHVDRAIEPRRCLTPVSAPRSALYEYAGEALARAANNPTRAAAATGIPRSTFYRWLKQGRIRPAD